MKKRNKWFNSLLWTAGSISGPVIYLVTAQLSFALTESFAISAAYVGIVFLLSRVFDGVTDFIAGYLIDRTHNRFGKSRIYDLFMIIAWIFVVFCFTIPSGFSEIGKVVFVFVVYNMYTSVFATFANCAETVRLKRSLDEEGRLHAVSMAGFASSMLSVVVSIAIPIMIAVWAGQPGGWTKIVLVFAVPCSILSVVRFAFMPEVETETEEEIEKNKTPVWESVKLVLKNKYAIIVLIIGTVQTLVATISGSMPMYYFTYIYGDVSAASISGMVSAVIFVAVAFIPKVVAKLGTSRTVQYSLFMGAAAFLLRYIAPQNIIWYAVCSAVSALGGMPLAYLMQVMLIDAIQYGKWRDGVAPEGVYASILSITRKVGAGVSSGIMGIILQMGALPDGGYSSGSILFLNNGYAALGFLIGAVALCFYDLDKKLPQINKELAAREA